MLVPVSGSWKIRLLTLLNRLELNGFSGNWNIKPFKLSSESSADGVSGN